MRNCATRSGVWLGAALVVVFCQASAWAAPKTHTPGDTTALASLLNTQNGPAGALELGDTIRLTAGTTYVGTFTLPNVSAGSGYITIESSAMSSLPAAGVRVKPLSPQNHAQHMPKLATPKESTAPAIDTATGAHHYKLIGLEILHAADSEAAVVLVNLGSSSATSVSSLPHNIIVDRCYIHGPAGDTLYTRRGIMLNSGSTDVINCHISDIYSLSNQAVGVGGINGPGPYTINNNYIAATGENILFGGGDIKITNQIPSNITITRNHLWKDPAWATTGDTCNHIEFKSGRQATIEGNLCENNWPGQGHNGASLVFKVSNVDLTSWNLTEDITVTKNIIRNVGVGMNFQGHDYSVTPHGGAVRNITARDNLFYDINTSNGNPGKFTNTSHGPEDVTIDHNTAFFSGTMYILPTNSEDAIDFVYTNNLTHHGKYGVMGSSTERGDASLTAFFTGLTFKKNVMMNNYPLSSITSYYTTWHGDWSPGSLAFPSSWTGVLVNYASPGTDFAGWKVVNGSTYDNAGTDGKDIGCDIDAVVAATEHCISGDWGTAPPPSGDVAASDSFTYSSTLNAGNGGTGFGSNAWTAVSGTTNPALTSGSLSYASGFKALVVSGNKLAPAADSRSYRNLPNAFIPSNGDVLWISFRANYTGGGGFPSNHAGFGLYTTLNADNTAGDELFLGNPGFSGQNWGFNPEGGTREVAPGDVSGGAPKDVFLLYKLEYGTTNATIKMWINPALTESGLGMPTETGTQPGLDAVRSVRFSTGSSSSGYQFDELRLGESFADVVPTVDMLIASEDFNYTGTLNGKTGGQGFGSNAWTAISGATNPALSTSSLIYTSGSQTLLVSGNKLGPANNSKSYRNLATAFTPSNGDVLWISFRANFTGAGGFPSNHSGFGFYTTLNADNTTGDELFLGNPGFSGQNWGFNPEGGDIEVAPGDVSAGAPKNVFLLYKLVYGSTDAAVSMWINPPLTEGSLPSPTITGTQPGLDPVRSVRFSTGSTSSGYQFDELRLGKTFESVTPKQ